MNLISQAWPSALLISLIRHLSITFSFFFFEGKLTVRNDIINFTVTNRAAQCSSTDGYPLVAIRGQKLQHVIVLNGTLDSPCIHCLNFMFCTSLSCLYCAFFMYSHMCPRYCNCVLILNILMMVFPLQSLLT